jgi:hypothetical protein
MFIHRYCRRPARLSPCVDRQFFFVISGRCLPNQGGLHRCGGYSKKDGEHPLSAISLPRNTWIVTSAIKPPPNPQFVTLAI